MKMMMKDAKINTDKKLPVFRLDSNGKELQVGDKFYPDATGGWHESTATVKETALIAGLVAFIAARPLIKLIDIPAAAFQVSELAWLGGGYFRFAVLADPPYKPLCQCRIHRRADEVL